MNFPKNSYWKQAQRYRVFRLPFSHMYMKQIARKIRFQRAQL